MYKIHAIALKRLLALIGRYLRAGIMMGSTVQLSELGTPQGEYLRGFGIVIAGMPKC